MCHVLDKYIYSSCRPDTTDCCATTERSTAATDCTVLSVYREWQMLNIPSIIHNIHPYCRACAHQVETNIHSQTGNHRKHTVVAYLNSKAFHNIIYMLENKHESLVGSSSTSDHLFPPAGVVQDASTPLLQRVHVLPIDRHPLTVRFKLPHRMLRACVHKIISHCGVHNTARGRAQYNSQPV